jgi:hypothetical protein
MHVMKKGVYALVGCLALAVVGAPFAHRAVAQADSRENSTRLTNDWTGDRIDGGLGKEIGVGPAPQVLAIEALEKLTEHERRSFSDLLRIHPHLANVDLVVYRVTGVEAPGTRDTVIAPRDDEIGVGTRIAADGFVTSGFTVAAAGDSPGSATLSIASRLIAVRASNG